MVYGVWFVVVVVLYDCVFGLQESRQLAHIQLVVSVHLLLFILVFFCLFLLFCVFFYFSFCVRSVVTTVSVDK